MHILSHRAPRTANRIVMFCTAINDYTSWPFWKFLQMKKIKGVTDLVMLAVTTESGTFEARIDGTDYTLKNMERVREFRPEVLEKFLERWHIPGHTYFVYGGHGMGDYLELEQWVTSLQCHELAAIMGKKQYQGILFDACFMANLDCAYYLRNNTKYIGASEGYMWEHDTALDKHIFNTYTASAMSRFKDPLAIFQLIERDYTSKTMRGDFAILDTTHAEELYNYCQKNVLPRIYDRVSFFTDEQQTELEELAHEAMTGGGMATEDSAGGEVSSNELLTNSSAAGGSRGVPVGSSSSSTWQSPAHSPSPPTPSKEACSERVGKREDQLTRAIQYEHSLYPSEVEDKHVLDLFQYLADIAREEQMAAQSPPSAGSSSQQRGGRLNLNLGDGRTPAVPGLVLPSRTANASLQGRIPSGQLGNTLEGLGDLSSVHDKSREVHQLSEGLELFNRVVVSHTPPQDEGVYATRLGGLSIVAPELSASSRTLHRTNYHRAAFKKKAAEFLSTQRSHKRGGVGEKANKEVEKAAERNNEPPVSSPSPSPIFTSSTAEERDKEKEKDVLTGGPKPQSHTLEEEEEGGMMRPVGHNDFDSSSAAEGRGGGGGGAHTTQHGAKHKSKESDRKEDKKERTKKANAAASEKPYESKMTGDSVKIERKGSEKRPAATKGGVSSISHSVEAVSMAASKPAASLGDNCRSSSEAPEVIGGSDDVTIDGSAVAGRICTLIGNDERPLFGDSPRQQSEDNLSHDGQSLSSLQGRGHEEQQQQQDKLEKEVVHVSAASSIPFNNGERSPAASTASERSIDTDNDTLASDRSSLPEENTQREKMEVGRAEEGGIASHSLSVGILSPILAERIRESIGKQDRPAIIVPSNSSFASSASCLPSSAIGGNKGARKGGRGQKHSHGDVEIVDSAASAAERGGDVMRSFFPPVHQTSSNTSGPPAETKGESGGTLL